MDSKIDYAAGIILKKKIGDTVSNGEALCVLEYNNDRKLHNAIELIAHAYSIGDAPPAKIPLIRQVVKK
jgi:thymidine phosphorylase